MCWKVETGRGKAVAGHTGRGDLSSCVNTWCFGRLGVAGVEPVYVQGWDALTSLNSRILLLL